MGNVLLGLLAETFIHAGAGSNKGAIDLPAARETASGYPFIPGSGMKGALRELAEQEPQWIGDDRVSKCFGHESSDAGGGAGGILVGDARLLLLPVRSLTGSYKWLTCPHLLERLSRDMQRAGCPNNTLPPIPEEPEAGNLLGTGPDTIFLEERTFTFQSSLPEKLVTSLTRFIPYKDTRGRLAGQLVVANSNEFTWFTNFALSVQARNDLVDKTKESNNLWYEESLPPDTLMYCLLAERIADGGMSELATLLRERKYLQAGGNETVGQGWFGIAVCNTEEHKEPGDEH